MKEVNSIDELVAGGEKDLQVLADAGSSIAREWLEKVQAESFAPMKLSLFGEMRIALMQDTRPEARVVAREMFPD